MFFNQIIGKKWSISRGVTINNINTIIRNIRINHLYLNLSDELCGSSLTLLLKRTKNRIGI